MSKPFKPRRPGPALTALTAAALALPAYQRAEAASRDEQAGVSVRASHYTEDALDRSQTAGDVTERFDITVGQAKGRLPVGQRFELSLDAAYETLSGASPWFIEPDENGEPVQVMSGATIDDARTDLLATVSRYGDRDTVSASVGTSREDDYLSYNVGLKWSRDTASRQTTWSLGASASDDVITPTDSDRFPLRPEEESKQSYSLVGSLSRILGKLTTWQTALSLRYLTGFLSDPYKQAFVDGTILADSRPDSRWQAALSTRLRRRVTWAQASLHADYRYFVDEWEVNSHTVKLAWHQGIGSRWELAPSLRYYSQSQAFFYRPFYLQERDDGLYSSDYRLSPYGALTYALSAHYQGEGWSLVGAVQRYDSEASLAIDSVGLANPGLVDFTLVSFGVEWRL